MTYRFDPELADFVALLPRVELTDIPAARAGLAALAGGRPPADPAGVEISDHLVAGPAGAPDVPVRVYRPEPGPDPAPVPAIYDIHGGGFVLGDLEMGHSHNLWLARELGAVVAAVDYRLAPEHPYPAGLEDCYAGLTWLAEQADEFGLDPDRIAVRGTSAGGGLAAALTMLVRDRGGPALCFQFLGIPELDDRLATGSMTRFTDTPFWHRANAVISWDAYLGEGVPGTDGVPPTAAPARATDLTGLPPAYISVMEFDPLRDEGIAYAQALLAAGVSVELHLFPGTFHGSAIVTEAAVIQREAREVGAVLRAALAVDPARSTAQA